MKTLFVFCGLLLLAGAPSALGALKKQRLLHCDVSWMFRQADRARASLTSLLRSLLHILLTSAHDLLVERRVER